MKQGTNILWLTSELLAHGGFNHLKDNQVSFLHHLLLRFREPLTGTQQNLLLNFWRNADASVLPADLLYRCDLLLQQHGFEPINVACLEMMGCD